MSDQAKRVTAERERRDEEARTEGPGRVNLLDLVPDQAAEVLKAYMAEIGEPSYRAGQVVRRLWVNPARSFDEMSELPAGLRARLAERFELPRLELAVEQKSTDGTRKFLYRLH